MKKKWALMEPGFVTIDYIPGTRGDKATRSFCIIEHGDSFYYVATNLMRDDAEAIIEAHNKDVKGES